MNERRAIEAYITSMMGVNYLWGGASPAAGFDCSGLVLELLKAVGIVEGHEDMTAQFILSAVAGDEVVRPSFGTLCFYGKSRKAISHIAWALNESMILEAGGGDSTTKSLAAAIVAGAFVRVRPLRARRDLIVMIHPSDYPWATEE